MTSRVPWTRRQWNEGNEWNTSTARTCQTCRRVFLQVIERVLRDSSVDVDARCDRLDLGISKHEPCEQRSWERLIHLEVSFKSSLILYRLCNLNWFNVFYRFGCDANGGSWGARALRELGHALQETAETAKAQTSTSMTWVQSGHWNAPIGLSKVSDPGDIYTILYICFTNFLYCKHDNMMYTYTYTYMVCFFSNETFQHQMICLALQSTVEKPVGTEKKSLSDPTCRNRPWEHPPRQARPETGRVYHWLFFEFFWFSFSRSRMPTIWKSLLALQLHANMHRFHAIWKNKNAFCAFGICQRFFFKKRKIYVKYVNAKDAKDAYEVAKCVQWVLILGMLPFCFLLAFLQDFKSSPPNVRPSWLPWHVIDTVTRYESSLNFAEFRHCHRGAVSFNWLILFHRCIPCQDARSCDFLLTTKYVKMNLNNFLRTFFSLSSLFKFFNWSSLYVKFPSGSKKHSEEAKTPKSRTHRHKTSFSQHGFCDGVRTSVVFCLTLPVTLQWPCNGPRKQSLIFKYVLLK